MDRGSGYTRENEGNLKFHWVLRDNLLKTTDLFFLENETGDAQFQEQRTTKRLKG